MKVIGNYMPELPEVEVVKKSLVKRILKNSIKKIKILKTIKRSNQC